MMLMYTEKRREKGGAGSGGWIGGRVSALVRLLGIAERAPACVCILLCVAWAIWAALGPRLSAPPQQQHTQCNRNRAALPPPPRSRLACQAHLANVCG